jgi:hypothetical protein
MRLGTEAGRGDRAVSWFLSASFQTAGHTTFLALLLVQGFHELEHIVQVLQRYMFAIPNGNGLIGSLVDIEPVHFVYNSLYLGMLASTYILLGLPRERARRYGPIVFGGLMLALVFQSWHEVEHLFKLAQYFALGVNGTGGVFGIGPGGIIPVARVPLLHLAYNTIAFVPAVIAFVALVRRS